MQIIWFLYSLKFLLVAILLASNWGGKLATYPAGASYDLRSNPLQIAFGNGASEVRSYDDARGWLERIDVLDVALTRLDRTDYTRSASGRVSRQSTDRPEGKFDYLYDYTGRLLSAVNFGGQPAYNQTFTYDTAGSMRSNSALGTYDYGATNAAHPHAPNAVGLDQFTYDLNGNMTVGLGGKVMTYDAENRPLSVSHNGTTTSYVYGPDGTRLKKTEGADTTVYFGPVEIRKFGQGAANEEIILYPHPNVRLVNGVASYLHTDQLGSVRVITGDTGSSAKETVYRPFGETVDFITDPTSTYETKGFIGERFDADAGLQYLNARYYDPALGIFIQPDWFGVTMAGVGTNRYAYSFNDPVNNRDANGNYCEHECREGGNELTEEEKEELADLMAGVINPMPDIDELTNGELTGRDAFEVLGMLPIGKAIGMVADVFKGARKAPRNVDNIVTHDTQVASPYPRDRVVGGKGEGRRTSDPESGTVEQGSWEQTQENLRRMEAGKPPLDANGNPIQLHHRNQSPSGPLDEMTQQTHSQIDHPLKPSQIDRPAFKGERARYWRERARTLLGQ